MRGKTILAAALLAGTMLTAGCDKVDHTVFGKQSEADIKQTAYPERVYWGDTHLHTANSVDAFGFGNRLSPEEALRFAMGQEVTTSTGLKAKLQRPLDFLVISDHAEGMGSTKAMYDAPRMMIKDPQMLRWYDMMHQGTAGSLKAMGEILQARGAGKLPAAMNDPVKGKERTERIWQEEIRTVENYYHPGKFTSFFGFEYTLMQGGNNLHRNVVFRDGPDKVSQVSPLDPTSEKWQDKLYDYMDAYEQKTGGKVLAIPHNSNLSNGLMFMLTEPNGGPMTAAYAKRRADHEPVVEITQMKGDSEAHPFLSPNDEFSGYGTAGWDKNNLIGNQPTKPEEYAGNYVREALKRGLTIEARTGQNPYKFGVIGSTDSHTSLSAVEEGNFFGKHPGVEPSNHRATDNFVPGSKSEKMNWQSLASGYAAVWATANTRGALWDAMKRREVYATTGPRMVVRFFAGWDFTQADLKGDWVKAGYSRGVPMGGQLSAKAGAKPSFLISALKDPEGANLDRVQVVKGWVDKAGQSHEKVFDVAWSSPDQRKIAGGKLSPVGDTVNTATASYQNNIGAPALTTVWTDPEYDGSIRAFYYLRVLEIPTPTWLDYDMVKYKLTLPADYPLKQQERGYTSPIWFNPA